MRLVVLLLLTASLALTSTAYAQRAVQLTADGSALMVNKPVGSQMWSIVVHFDDQSIAGNVFNLDGSDPQFVWCEILAPFIQGPDDFVGVSSVVIDCKGADGCGALPCSPGNWTEIGETQVVGSFFLPPGGVVPPTPTVTPHQPTPHPTVTPLPQQDSLSALIGTWQFRFTIISTFTDTYRLQRVEFVNGKRGLLGLDQFGDLVLAARIQELSPGSPLPYEFELLDPGVFVCEFHVFNRTGPTTITGETAVMLTDSAGDCDPTTIVTTYPLAGNRTSVSAITVGAERLGAALTASIRAAQDDVRRLEMSESAAPDSSDGIEAIRSSAAALLEKK